jgi:hypothetical protein
MGARQNQFLNGTKAPLTQMSEKLPKRFLNSRVHLLHALIRFGCAVSLWGELIHPQLRGCRGPVV